MSTATFHTTSSLRSYLHDVGVAARNFARALMAAQERQFVPQEMDAAAKIGERARARNHMRLIAMANEYQDMQPSLAAELRQLAARG